MANIGSAFLGDVQAKRIRQLSSPPTTAVPTSPPSSPPATAIPNTNRLSMSQSHSPPSPQPQAPSGQHDQARPPLQNPPNKATIDPSLALELRVRWLEALVLGCISPNSKSAHDAPENEPKKNDVKKQTSKSIQSKTAAKQSERGKEGAKAKESAATLARLTENVQKRLDAIVDTNEGLKRFMDSYHQYAQYLTPTFALSGIINAPMPSTPTSETSERTKSLDSSLLPLYENMSPQELEVFLAEMEPDLRAADRDMLEIETLVAKGVTGAGKLGDYEALKPRLETLIREHEEDAKLANDLEKRVAKLVERHATQVDVLSELFVAWDDALVEAEGRTVKLEKDLRERRRLGLVP